MYCLKLVFSRIPECASVCVSWRSAVVTASAMGMFKSTLLCVSAGTYGDAHGLSVVCTTGGICMFTFNFGCGVDGRLGHGNHG